MEPIVVVGAAVGRAGNEYEEDSDKVRSNVGVRRCVFEGVSVSDSVCSLLAVRR